MAIATRRAVRSLFAGAAVGALAFAVVDAVRPRPGPARLVDWDEIRVRALGRVDPAEALDPAAIRRLADEYNQLAAEVAGPLLEFVGGHAGTLPPFQALDRFGWVDLNLGIMRDVLEPIAAVEQRLTNSRLLDYSRGLLDRYAGLMLGFLSQRVLGQYDPQLLGREPAGEPGLYLVEPNVALWQSEAGLPGKPLRRWLILHEMTHAWQFGAHPWLRDHFNGMLREVLGAALDRRRGTLDRALALSVGLRGQLEVVNRVQATMSLVEGYSNLVMDVVGRDLLPEFEALEAAHEARTGEKTIFERAFWRLTGLELKLQQYVVGERFCKSVFDAHGMAVLNRAWEGPGTLPTPDELREPARWVDRIRTVPETGSAPR